MLRITDDLIFLDRLNREEFLMLLFPNSKQADGKTPSIYALNKWDLFIQDKLFLFGHVLWTKLKYLLISSMNVRGNEYELRLMWWLI